jgi:hypothetical protein
MTPDNARFMLKQRGYPEGGDWLSHCIRRGQAGNDVGLELALIMMAQRASWRDGATIAEIGAADAPMTLSSDALERLAQFNRDAGLDKFVVKRGPGRPRKDAA